MKRFLARTLLFFGLPIVMKGSASPTPQDPLRALDRCLSAAEPSEGDVACAVDTFFGMTGITDVAVLKQFRPSIIKAEMETRYLRRPMIEEAAVAATFTSLMREIHAPAWAGATPDDVHDLREALALVAPKLVANEHGVVAHGLWPIEALYLIHLLGLNGRLIKDETLRKLNETTSSGAPAVSRKAAGSFITDPRTTEFVSFRRQFLESQSHARLVEIGHSVAVKLRILQ
jgi:hypothetical protein